MVEIPLTPDAKFVQAHNIWLRENCRCQDCYTAATNQRKVLFHQFDPEVEVQEATLGKDGQTLSVVWSDGHNSLYDAEWLKQNLYPGVRMAGEKYLWNKLALNTSSPEAVDFTEFTQTDEGLKRVLSDLVQFGFALVRNTPGTEEYTQLAAERLCFVQQTLFGAMWTFTADMARADTAYTSTDLGPHTDTTYLAVPAGIQVR